VSQNLLADTPHSSGTRDIHVPPVWKQAARKKNHVAGRQGKIRGPQGDGEGAPLRQPDCKLCHVPVKPEGLAFFYLPRMVYGTDVVFFVGEKRLKDWLYRQIREALDVKPALSSLSGFFHLFEQLAQCFLETQEGETKAVTKKQGGYILMADATEHRRSKPTHHVVDALSGRPLAAETLEKTTTTT